MSAFYLRALAVTLVVELAGLAALLGSMRGRLGLSPRRIGLLLLLALATNLVSHRTFWFVFPVLPGGYTLRLTLAEAAVTLFEGAVYAGVGRLQPVALAFGAAVAVNLLSWWAGALLL